LKDIKMAIISKAWEWPHQNYRKNSTIAGLGYLFYRLVPLQCRDPARQTRQVIESATGYQNP
jgi:hypothetical protein